MGWRDRLGGFGRGRAEREEAVRLAAVEAADEDPLFAHDLVERRAAALFVAIQRAWSVNDIVALRQLVGSDLMVEWQARLADFDRKGWRNQVEVLDGPHAHYVAVTNRADDADDRVVVQVTARVRDVVIDRYGQVLPSDEGEIARVNEFWTLGKRDGEWIVLSIEQQREGAHHLSSPLIPVPESDQSRLRADAVMEVASADDVRAGEVGALISPAFSGDARAAALDLSLVDGRFAPDVLATAVGEVVEAWMQAIDGPDEPLAARTTPQALQALLYPSSSQHDRLVIRGADVRETTIVAVTGGSTPQVELELAVAGVQYIEDRDTTEVLAGSKRRQTTTRQHWTVRLGDDPRYPWAVVDARGVRPR
jgi:hypothetical protein